MTVIRAAVIQLNAKPAIEENLREAEALIRAAAKDKATLIVTPENTCRMRAKVEDKFASFFEEKDHPAIPVFAKLAASLGITLVIGSLSSVKTGSKLANRSFVFRKDGSVAATYDKMHMFDVDLAGGEKYRESDSHAAGSEIVMTEEQGAKIGLSICYDVRFPQLYRALAKKGAEILTIPSAFTVPTGKAHWHVLLRARAIENGAFVVAPAQVGTHEGGRATWGHSMIVDPWGKVLVEIQKDSPGFACADLDLAEVRKARTAIPSLTHDRF
jgi:deaminated glutathione amidase